MNAADARRKYSTEAQFMAGVVELAEMHGWLIHHCRPAQTSKGWRTPIQGHPGFPDLLLVRRQVLFVELKMPGKEVTAFQARWEMAVRLCPGAEYYLWTPADWNIILKILQ